MPVNEGGRAEEKVKQTLEFGWGYILVHLFSLLSKRGLHVSPSFSGLLCLFYKFKVQL